MRIFLFDDYRKYLQAQIKTKPKGGRGELLRMAEAAGMHPSTLSLVFQGTRDLTLEQAASISDYWGHSNNETRYFLLLVQFSRAGTNRLRQLLKTQLDGLRGEANEMVRRIPVSKILSPEQKAVFYSNWHYSAVRVLSSIPRFQTIEQISERLNLPRSHVNEVVRFLVRNQLCIKEDGNLRPGPQSTHIETSSPLVSRHHANWRVKAMERHPVLSREHELAYTSPMTLSKKDIVNIKELLAQAIEKACAVVDHSPSEAAYCLNIDWFEIR